MWFPAHWAPVVGLLYSSCLCRRCVVLAILSSWPAWAYCPARRSYFSLPPFSLFSSLSSLFLLHLLSPSPPAFLLRFSSPPPLLSLKVFAQSGSAQRGSTFCSYHPKWSLVAMSDASRLVPPMIFSYRLQSSIQSKVIGILWKVGGNRRRRGKGSCCPAASGTSGWLLFELELLDCHNTYELTLIRIRLGKT